MRNLIMVLMVAGLMSTVGVYAASVTGSPKALGGTGSVTVSAPTSSTVTSTFITDSSGDVTSVKVGWTPSSTNAVDIRVIVGSSTGTLSVTPADTTAREDTISISPVVAADLVTTAEVIINES